MVQSAPGGVSAPGCVPAPEGCGDPPVTATAAGGTHPTGMHSCLFFSRLSTNHYTLA